MQKENCQLQISTINCQFRLPSAFENLRTLLTGIDNDSDEAEKPDIYSINLQQIVYRGKRTIFSGDAEQAPARAWLAAIPEVLKRAA